MWIIALLLASPLAAQPEGRESRVVDRIFRRVNGKVITLSEIQERAAVQAAGRQQDIEQVVQQVIVDKLQLQDADKQGIQVSQEHIDWYIDNQVRQKHGGDATKLLQALSANGVSLLDFRERSEEDIQRELYFRKQGVRPAQNVGLIRPRSRFDFDVTVTELRRYFRDHAGELSEPTQVRWTAIILPIASFESLDEARSVIWGLRNQLRQFGLVALRSRIEAELGKGTVLEFPMQPVKELLPEELKKLAVELPNGEWSEPIETEDEIQIYFPTERIAGRPMTFAEAQPMIRTLLTTQKQNQVQAQVRNELLDEASVQAPDEFRRPATSRR
ncbi:MAG: peptidylprolyl isomerase [Planctomycetota bacterium]